MSSKTAEISHTLSNEMIDISAHELESLYSTLHEVHLKNQQLPNDLVAHNEVLEKLCTEQATANAGLEKITAAVSETEIETLQKDLKVQTVKAKKYWSQKCEQLLLHEAAIDDKNKSIAVKDTEITSLDRSTTRVETPWDWCICRTT